MRRSYQVAALVAGIMVAVGVVMVWERISHAARTPQIKNLSKTEFLANGCYSYAVDSAGRFPMHLSELEPAYVRDLAAMQCAIVRNGKDTGERVDWLYFGAGFSMDKPPAILIASPPEVAERESRSSKRIYMAGDGRGTIAPEAEYQKLLAETVRQMKARDAARRSPSLPNPPAPAP